MISDHKNGRAVPGQQEDKRLEAVPGREDDLSPYSRKGDTVNSVIKGGYVANDSGGSNFYRWIAGLGGEADLNRPYAQHPYIYACVTAIGRAASSVPARMQRKVNGEFVTVEDTVLSQVLQFPNPLQSQRKFFRAICTSQQLYGETFLILLKKAPNGKMVPVEAVGGTSGMMALIEEPEEIWPVRGDLVEALIDSETKLPAMWRFSTATGHVDYPAHAIVQIAEVNPYNPLRGMGPMQAAYRTASKDFIIDRYDEALLQNGGSPGGVLTVDGPLTDADQRAIRESWQESHGRPESHRKTAVLPQGTTYKEIGMTPQSMEHEKLRKWDRTTILSMFGVPPVVLGLETMNYATAREQNRIFWETTVLPYLDFLKDEIQYKLINRINSPVSELLLDFDISSVSALREDMDAKVDRTIKLYSEGHRSFVEAARLSGWDIDEETLEGSEDRWIPSTLVRADEVGVVVEDDAAIEETRAVDQERLDEVYAAWRKAVNMSASELESWSKNECSKKASLDPSAVIARNLSLLRTKKSDWTAKHVKDANRAISFISRMRGAEQGEPAAKGCPSKRDISLKNWGYNPSKANRGFEGAEDCLRDSVDRKYLSDMDPADEVSEVSNSWPSHLATEESRYNYWKLYTLEEEDSIQRIEKKATRIMRDMLLAARKRLREVANEDDWSVVTSAPAGEAKDLKQFVYTESEIHRLLDLDLTPWGEDMASEIAPILTQLMLQSAQEMAGQINTDPLLVSETDRFILDFYKDYPAFLTLGPMSTLSKDISRMVLRTLMNGDFGGVGSLGEAIHMTMRDQELGIQHLMKMLPDRVERIAKTETNTAHNASRVEQMRRGGVGSHIWLSSRDTRVRESHQLLDGEQALIGEPFSNGVIYPGQPGTARPEEIINCRCTTIPVLR